MSSTIQSEKYNIYTTIVRGIVCKKCGVTLPDMLMCEHLDITNPKNKMCGCIKSESAKKIDANSCPMPERQNNIQSVTMNTTTITKSKKVCVCSACGKTGHRKSNEKFHPIVPKVEDLQDEQDLIIIKSSAPTPIPAPVFLPRKHRGECGLENGEIHFPLLRMGCSEDAKGIVMTITIPLRPIIDKAFFEDFAKIMRKYPMFDWSAMSFMRNIIHPNREHIKRTMNLDDQYMERVMEDTYVVINQWYKSIGEETYDKLGNLEYNPANHATFFTCRHCDY